MYLYTVGLNLGWRLSGYQAKRYNQAANWEKDLLLAAKRMLGIFSKAVFQNSKIGEFLCEEYLHTHEGA